MDRDLLDIFKPPWRILRHKSGNYHVVDAAGRELCWIYVKGKQVTDHKLLDDEEAQALAKRLLGCRERAPLIDLPRQACAIFLER